MNFPIKECPRCKGTKIVRKERYKGIGYVIDTLSDDPRQAQRDMLGSDNYFDDAQYTFVSKWWICSKCNKKLFTNDEYIEWI